MTWTIPTYSSKMAENQDASRSGSIFVGREARALLNAMAYFENERQRGRAGGSPMVANNNGVGRVVGGVGVYHMLGLLFWMLECQNQGVSHPGEGGAEASSSLHPPYLKLWAEDFPHSHPFHPFPLKIIPHLGGARRPLLDNHALCPIVCNPMVISQPHLPMLFVIQMPPTL